MKQPAQNKFWTATLQRLNLFLGTWGTWNTKSTWNNRMGFRHFRDFHAEDAHGDMGQSIQEWTK